MVKVIVGVLMVLLMLGVFLHSSEMEADYDVAIRGGTLYLGGFEMGPTGDIAVRNDRIVAVGNVPGRAEIEIDAGGMIVSPGFIDLHTHSDLPFIYLKSIPKPKTIKANLNYITQGVTTVVTGNCGVGMPNEDFDEKFLDKIDKIRFGSNLIHLVPHGDLRLLVMGESQAERADPKPTAEEMGRMKKILEKGLRSGAWGMSTGLEYDPGARADIEELVELNRVVARHGGVYASHIRHEGPDREKLADSIREAIAIGERAGTRVQISHIKCAGKTAHGMSDTMIEIIEAARQRGVKVTADQYPYNAGSTTLSAMVPVEYRNGPKVLKKYCSSKGREKLYPEVARVMENYASPDEVLISLYPWKPWYQGKTIAQVAEKKGVDPVKFTVDLACGMLGTGIYFTQNEDDIRNFMKKDWVSTSSDGWVFIKSLGKAHPRLYGTFPRKIRRYVYDEKIISLPFALRSMTELPAKSFQIPERGRLAVGYYADVVVFDPDKIRDVATWENPNQYSEGIQYLLVNGVLTVSNGKYTGKRGGRALRHQSK